MDIKSKLNEKQYQAAGSDSQYLRIIAGAGTGKTRTLSYKIAYLIDQGMLPTRIVAITFTNKAAKEMLSRVDGILEKESDTVFQGKPLISTFHGFCYRFLKKEIYHISPFNNSFTLLDDNDQNAIYKSIFKSMVKGDSKEFIKEVTGKISQLKSDGRFLNEVTPNDVPLGALYSFDELIHVYQNYQYEMLRQNCLDFDDLLMFTSKIMHDFVDVRLTWQSKYDIFLVDEFQDTNLVQYDLVKLFMRKEGTLGMDDRGTRLTVVGDPDQTIYTWRGAKNELIKTKLQKDFPSLETVVLDDNYRSTQNILDCANKVIANNHDRIAKNLNAASKVVGAPVSYINYSTNDMEGYGIASLIHRKVSSGEAAYNDIAIIYRANYLSNALEKQLTAFKIPYQIYGGLKFYERAEIKDALSYLRVLVNPDDFSFQRILNAPTKGIGDVTLAKAKEVEKSLGSDATLLDVFRSHSDELKLNRNSRAALDNFYAAYDSMVELYRSSCDNATLESGIRTYFAKVGFLDYVMKEDKKAAEKLTYTAATSTSKVDNVNEFMRSLTQALDTPTLDENGNEQDSTLEDFLISVALQSDQDTMKDLPQVSLMTGHVSKGLEFPIVFVTGMNDSIFPSSHAINSGLWSAIEEERRLFYVCMTRAQKFLYISSFGGKNFRSNGDYVPSQFIKETGLRKPANGSSTSSSNRSNDYYASLGIHRPTTTQKPSYFKPNNTAIRTAAPSVKPIPRPTPSATQNAVDTHYEVGDRVVHTSFGKGTVTKIVEPNIIVLFPDPYGEKRLRIGFKAYRKIQPGEE